MLHLIVFAHFRHNYFSGLYRPDSRELHSSDELDQMSPDYERPLIIQDDFRGNKNRSVQIVETTKKTIIKIPIKRKGSNLQFENKGKWFWTSLPYIYIYPKFNIILLKHIISFIEIYRFSYVILNTNKTNMHVDMIKRYLRFGSQQINYHVIAMNITDFICYARLVV